MIKIDNYEAIWSCKRGVSEAAQGHHESTACVAPEVALTALVRQFDPNISATVESIDRDKIILSSAYSLTVSGLTVPQEDGIARRPGDYGFIITFSLVAGSDEGLGIGALTSTAWAFLHMDERLRGEDIKRVFAKRAS